MKQYISSYTGLNPNQYTFTRHLFQTYNYSPGFKTHNVPVTCDKVPDKITLTVIDSEAHVGMVTKNPHIFYKLPPEFKCQFEVNSSSMYREKEENHRECYRRMKQSLMPKNNYRLIKLTDYEVN